MKKVILISALLILIFGCSETMTYYETPINNWLSENLNDYSSYEPIDFTVLSNNNDLYKYIDLFGFQNVVQRKVNIVTDLILEIKKMDGIDSKELTGFSGFSQSLSKLNSQSDYSINSVDSLNKLLDEAYEIQINMISSNTKSDLLELCAQYEGTSYRYQVELKNLDAQLLALGTDLKNCESDIKNGLFIHHKFRTKNSFGALAINSKLFKLDDKKEKILKVRDSK